MPKKKIPSCENIESIKNTIDTIIFDEKERINNKIRKIPEVTYSYYEDYKNNTNINSTFFSDIGGIDIEKIKNSTGKKRRQLILQGKETFEKKVRKKYTLLGKYTKKLEKIETTNMKEKYEKEIIIKALREKRLLLKYALNSVPIELEKSGIKINYNPIDIRKKQEKIDNEIFGGQIRDNLNEVKLCYNLLKNFYCNGKAKLSQKEQERFESYLKKIEKILPKKYKVPKIKEKKSLLDAYNKIELEAKEYIPSFNLILEALNGVQHSVSRNNEAGSISDGPNGIEFPINQRFQKILTPYFLKLADHELDVHSLTDHNHSQILGKIRGAKCIDKEEGLAKFRELMLEYGEQLFIVDRESGKTIINTSKIPMTKEFPNILMGELLSNKELIDFLELKEKIEIQKRSPLGNYLRLKRSNNLGVQHKDCSYTRGLFRVVKEINTYILSDGKKGINYKDLYIGKVGFDDIYKLKTIKESKEKTQQIQLDIKKPLYPGDTILFFLTNKLKKDSITRESLLKNLQKKYPIIDFTTERIIEVTNKTKKSLNLAMLFLDNNIEKNQHKKKTQEKTFLGTIEASLEILTGGRKANVEKYNIYE